MLILGIETSCDETAAAVLKIASGISLLSNTVSSQIKLHAKTGGVVPEVAAREHIVKIIPVVDLALKQARIKIRDIDVIAVTAGPGLITSLMVGVDTAKTFAMALDIPIVAINHIEAHVFSPFIQAKSYKLKAKSSVFPAISLVVSGGHTELFLVKGWLNYKKLGQTLDDAAGECFDKCAKLLGLPYPGGPALARLAEKGKPTVAFPRPMINSKNLNFSFSGLKTAVLYYLRDHKLQLYPAPSAPPQADGTGAGLQANLAASIQQAIVDVLVAKTANAVQKYKAKTILVGGGVAANDTLRKKLKAISYKFTPYRAKGSGAGLKANLLIARPEYCTDNAAMISFAGWLHSRRKNFTPLDKVIADSNWEL